MFNQQYLFKERIANELNAKSAGASASASDRNHFKENEIMAETDRLEPTKHELETVKKWLKSEPHLPDEMNECLMKRFLHSCHYDIQRTTKTIELFYTIRSNAPEIFANRDPNDPEIKNALDMSYMCPLPKLSPDRYKVFIYKLRDTNPDAYSFNPSVKSFFMLADARLALEEEIAAGEVPIFDMTGVTLRYVTKLVFSTLKKYMLYTQEAHPVRLKQIHVLNSASYVDKLYNIVKPLIKSEVMSMIHFHTPNSETLYKFVPKEMLPEEYGGNAGKLEDIRQYWVDQITAHRDYYLNDSLWKVDESKRRHGTKIVPEESVESFKSLSID